jgi:signal transduction histidine kinase
MMGDVLPDGMLIADADGGVNYANEQLWHFCGGQRSSAVSDVFCNIFGGGIRGILQVAQSRFVEAPEGCLEAESSVQWEDSQHLVIISKPLPQVCGELRLWLFRDVTKIREMEREVSRLVNLETVSRFAAGVAHNFNNILGTVLGSIQLLQRTCEKNDRVGRCIALIKESVESGCRLTKRLSDATPSLIAGSRTIGGQELIDAIEEQAHRPEFLGGTAACRVRLDPQIAELAIDVADFPEIIGNLVDNAVDALRDSGEVSIEGSADLDGRVLTIKVRDTGIGMDSATCYRVYEPFFSTKNLDSRNGVSRAGNGLGMWNVYNLIKTSGGPIDVTSAPGKGTEVKVCLPIVPAK